MIAGVGKAVAAVDDQDKAQGGLVRPDRLGRPLDEPCGNEPWIEVAPPARSLRLVLVVDVRGPRRQRHPRSAGSAGLR
jgi:hypothetical protein